MAEPNLFLGDRTRRPHTSLWGHPSPSAHLRHHGPQLHLASLASCCGQAAFPPAPQAQSTWSLPERGGPSSSPHCCPPSLRSHLQLRVLLGPSPPRLRPSGFQVRGCQGAWLCPPIPGWEQLPRPAAAAFDVTMATQPRAPPPSLTAPRRGREPPGQKKGGEGAEDFKSEPKGDPRQRDPRQRGMREAAGGEAALASCGPGLT